jgi:hypothetical protein
MSHYNEHYNERYAELRKQKQERYEKVYEKFEELRQMLNCNASVSITYTMDVLDALIQRELR